MSKGRYFCGGSALAVTLALSIGGVASAQDSLTAFNAADANGNAELTAEEIANLPAQYQASAVDRDGNGIVTMQEYLDSAIAAEGRTVEAVTSVGSLIRGAPEGAALPVEVIGREELEARGNPNIEELIRDFSEIGNVQSQSARGANANGYGVTSINLRNLGSGRTLLTFNGVRLADDPASNGGGVNVTGGANQNANAVPMEVLSQVEILKDGGGATYGSDAVAGVVNFVPRRDLDGFDVRTNYTFIDGNDGNYDINVQWGKRRDDGEGDFLLSFFYDHRSSLASNEVPFVVERAANFYSTPLPSTVPNFIQSLGAYWFMGSAPGTTALQSTTLNRPISATNGLFRDDACIRLGGFRNWNLQSTIFTVPVCSYRRTDFEDIVDESSTYRVFGQVNMNITDRFKYHGDMTFNKTVTTITGLDLGGGGAACDPLPEGVPAADRDCISTPVPAGSAYSVPGYNPATRDYLLRFYNVPDTARVFSDTQIADITGMSVLAGCDTQFVSNGACFNGGNLLTAGAGVQQGYIPVDGDQNNRYGRILLPTDKWIPFIAMYNDAFNGREPEFQNYSMSFRTTQELTGDLGSIFGNAVDFTLRATYSRNITQLEGRSLMSDRLQRALNGFGTDLDNFGADGCTADETSGIRYYSWEPTPTGSTFVASDPQTSSPFFGRAIFERTATAAATGFTDPDGTGPIRPRRLAEAVASLAGATGTTAAIDTPYTVNAGGGAGNAPNGFDPGAAAGNGCFFFNPFASAVDVSRLNGETPLATSTDVGFVDANNGYGGITGDYQGYAPGLGLQNSPGLVRWMFENRESRRQSDTVILDLIFNGTVENFQLPGGDIQWALGGQYRYVHRTGTTTQLNDRNTNPCSFLSDNANLPESENIINDSSTCGGTNGPFFNTSEPSGISSTGYPSLRESVAHSLFTELSLPFHDRLTGSLRYRYEESKSPGATEFIGASVFSGGLKYDINDYFAVAVDLSQSFDVPSTEEPGQTLLVAVDNPTNNDFFVGTDNSGLAPSARSLLVNNVNLGPESGFNYTVRLLFQTPDRRVTANIDYYNIRVSGRPTTVTAGTIGRALTGNQVFGSNVNVDAEICSNPNSAQFFDTTNINPLLGGPIISYVDQAGNIVDTGGCLPGTTLRGFDGNGGDVDGSGNPFDEGDDLGLFIRTFDSVNGGDQRTSGLDFGIDFRVPRPIFDGQLTLSADASWTLQLFNAEVNLFGINITQSTNNIGLQAGGFAAQGNIWRGSVGAIYRRGRHQVSLRGVYVGPIVDHAIATLFSTTTGTLGLPTSSTFNLNPNDPSICNTAGLGGLPLPFSSLPVDPLTGVPQFTNPGNSGDRDTANPDAILIGQGALNTNCNLPQPDGLKVDPSFILNANYRVQLPRETTLSVTIDNILDTDPPFQRFQYGYNPFGSIGPYGRTIKVGLQKRFQ